MAVSNRRSIQLCPVGVFEQYYPEGHKQTAVALDELPPGIHQTGELFFRISSRLEVEWVVSRVCDHANGKLVLCKNQKTARCPLHGWELDLDRLRYRNVAVDKKQLEFHVKGNTMYVDFHRPALRVPETARFGATGSAAVRFLAHACLAIDMGDIRIVTDPWLLGPCFMTGWWHAVLPKADALDILADANLVYISHNHPDHLHRETLQHLKRMRPDVPIVFPAFESQSVVRSLCELGFANVYSLPFNSLYRIEDTATVLSLFKSGDFRDDSGLFVASDDFSCLLAVDSAALNHMILPTHVDLLATAFAGGASGYPWCFEYYSIEERASIGQRHRMALRKLLIDYIQAVQPKAYMPYAGFFVEAAARDSFIKAHNEKNGVDEIREIVQRVVSGLTFIDPRETEQITFTEESAPRVESVPLEPLYEMNESYVNAYLQFETGAAEDFEIGEICDYFMASGFKDKLILYVQPAADDFTPLGRGVRVDFRSDRIVTRVIDSVGLVKDYQNDNGDTTVRKLMICVRRAPLCQVIRKRLPWEDLSIGFQCRIERRPDVYNSDFWYYFTNVYIGSEHIGRAN